MRIVYSAEARADLSHIARYIGRDSKRMAHAFTQSLRDKIKDLVLAPQGFPLVPRYEHYGIRRRPYRDYLIFYKVDADQISIVHILHGAQDYEAILFPET